MKKFFFIAVLVLISLFSCKESVEVSSEQKDFYERKWEIEVPANELAQFTVTYASELRSESEEKPNVEALAELNGKLFSYIEKQKKEKSIGCTVFSIVHNKEEKTFSVSELIMYDFEKIPAEFAMAFAFADQGTLETLRAEVEKLTISCEGGNHDGESMAAERPTGPGSAIKFAKKTAEFMSNCLDGGGCVKVCKAEFTLS